MRLKSDVRQSLEDAQRLLIPVGNGQQVPLSKLADVSVRDGTNQIQREDAKRRIVVGFNVRGRDVQSIVHELQDKVSEKSIFRPDITLPMVELLKISIRPKPD